MTLRELLSCWDERAVLRLALYDRNMDTKYLKVCFAHAEDCEEDLLELDDLADERVTRWYFHSDRLIVVLNTKFWRELK